MILITNILRDIYNHIECLMTMRMAVRSASPSGWGGVLDEPKSALHPGTREFRSEAPLGADPYFYLIIK
jgi:hypothetical protein